METRTDSSPQIPGALLVALLAATIGVRAVEDIPKDDVFPVPGRPNLRIVDYGSDMGDGGYRGQQPNLFSGPSGTAAVDSDGDGDTADDSVSGWAFSLEEPFNPQGDFYNSEAPSARFYGGIIGYHSNNPQARITEGMLNANHEYRDDCNMMSTQSIESRTKGNFVQAWGVWLWKKEDFLLGGADAPVTFDDDSLIAVHISRYWDDVDGGRWVVGDGDQLFISEATFGSPEDLAARGRNTRMSWPLQPTRTKWAPYSPKRYRPMFDPKAAAFKEHTFSDVTSVGFYIAKDSLTTGVIAVKWHAFETYAVVKRPDAPSYVHEMVQVPAANVGGNGVHAFLMSTTEITYKLWKRIYHWAVSNQYCFDLDQRGYVFDRDGDMGSMDIGGADHSADEPATDMTWLDAVAWCNALSEFEGLTPCYYADPEKTRVLRVIKGRNKPEHYDWKPTVHVEWEADGFRLPAPAEWACAAGTGKDADGAWLAGNSDGTTRAVGTAPPNGLGLHDLFGNVWEFVWHVTGDTATPGDYASPLALGAGFLCKNEVVSPDLKLPLDTPAAPAPSRSAAPGSALPGAEHVNVPGARNASTSPTEVPKSRPLSSPNMPRGEAGLYPVTPQRSSPGIGLRVVRGTGAPPLGVVAGVPGWRVDPVGAPAAAKPATAKLLPSDAFVKIANGGYKRYDDADVTVTDFYMGKTEVSYRLWNVVQQWAVHHGYEFDHDGDMGSMDWDTGTAPHGADEPVTDVGSFDARVFCNALSELEGRTPVYYADADKSQVYRKALPWRIRMIADDHIHHLNDLTDAPIYTKWEADGYRLPTWTEWNVAWRAGDAKQFMYGKPGSAFVTRDRTTEWLADTSGERTRDTGSSTSNELGIFDLGGNVSEWLHDSPVDDYYRPQDPRGRDEDGLFGSAIAGGHFRSGVHGGGQRPHFNKKSAGWPWLGFRIVRCDANAHTDKPFEPKVVLDVDAANFDVLQGRTFRANLHRTGYYGAEGLPTLGGEKWKFKTGGPVRSSPVVVDGILYVGSSDGHIYALDTQSGAEKWKIDTGGDVDGSATVVDLPAPPGGGQAGGTVYIGSQSGFFYALDAATGKERWKAARDPRNPTRYPITTSPAVAHGTIFIGLGTWGGFYSGLSAETGEEVWRLRLTQYKPNSGMLAPTVVGTTLYAPVSDITLLGIDIRTEIPAAKGHGNHCQASLAYSDGLLFYNTGKSMNINDATTLEKVYRRDVQGGGLAFFPQSGPAYHDGIAYYAKGDNRIYALAVKDREVTDLWDAPTPALVQSSIGVAGEEIYFGCDDGYVYALDRETGAQKWMFETGGPVASSPWVADGALYVGSDDGHVYALH